MAIEQRIRAVSRKTEAERDDAPRRAAKRILGFLGALVALAAIAPSACSSPSGPDGLFTSATSGGSGGAGGAATTSSSDASTSSSGAGGTSASSGAGGTASSSTGGPMPTAVCINEVMPDNQGALVDETGATPEWIELHNPTNADVDLEGWSLTNDLAMPKASVLPKGLTLPANGFLVLYADGQPQVGPKHLAFTIQASGGVVGLFDPNGASTELTYMSTKTNVAVARVPDCCAGDACLTNPLLGTPGKSNVVIPTKVVEVLPAGSTYRYLDTGVAPAAAWINAGFDDSAWASGPAPLGYGDAHIITTVSYGPNQLNKYITTWVRTTFKVTGASDVVSATLEILRDDGAVAYLNGTEVARTNMPAGAIDATTLASAGVTGAEETTFFPFTVEPKLFVEGDNVLAIEVHQQTTQSSDLGVDARVSLEVPAP